jgi:hypothetical protein
MCKIPAIDCLGLRFGISHLTAVLWLNRYYNSDLCIHSPSLIDALFAVGLHLVVLTSKQWNPICTSANR